jgi:hypothetical protein
MLAAATEREKAHMLPFLSRALEESKMAADRLPVTANLYQAAEKCQECFFRG